MFSWWISSRCKGILISWPKLHWCKKTFIHFGSQKIIHTICSLIFLMTLFQHWFYLKNSNLSAVFVEQISTSWRVKRFDNCDGYCVHLQIAFGCLQTFLKNCNSLITVNHFKSGSYIHLVWRSSLTVILDN